MKYKPRKGARISKKQAQVYGERIDYLMKLRGGELTPNDILNDGKDKNSPFHNYFMWDDTKAATEYRLSQARYLLRSVVIEVKLNGGKAEQRSFWNVENDNKETVYVTLETATSNEKYRNQLIKDIINHLDNTKTLLKLFMKYQK